MDLFEDGEAFASIPMTWLPSTDLGPAKRKVHGGGMANAMIVEAL